jgi:hypothetical protein
LTNQRSNWVQVSLWVSTTRQDASATASWKTDFGKPGRQFGAKNRGSPSHHSTGPPTAGFAVCGYPVSGSVKNQNNPPLSVPG